jgi:hypothetical protein
MPLFGRKKQAPEPPPPAAEAPPPMPSGDLACDYPDCTRHDGLRCAYGDRRQAHCQTQWCPDHYVLVEGLPYCRRHVAVAEALLAHEEGLAAAPDIHNRAPSLCAWVANSIDDEVRSLLTAAVGGKPGVAIVADPLELLLEGTPRMRYWERSWKLSDNLGTLVKLNLRVAEANDREVLAMVGREVVAALEPPWVNRPAVDARSREEFQAAILDHFRSGLDNYLTLNTHVFRDRLGGR